MKRALSCMLVLACLVLLFSFNTSAASTQPSVYSDQYNSGTRDVTCTTLSGTGASSYYTDSYTYNMLSSQSENALLQSLRTLMTSTHTYRSSYDDCHYKANRTDCENGSGNVSLIYTSYSATMSQWNGWNREHVWPQSLGGGNTSGGGADLHHIRPSDSVVNSTRGNKKYGYANGGKAVYGKNPATGCLGGYSSTYFEPLDNVKGDVARICLYVYVRWGSSWGADSITEVFQSVDVLLEWMELDPVDTWEMGRNEVVEDIQGNRNVFIDYPEYAWLLFGKDVPSDLVSPSGNAGSGSSTPSCTHASTEIRNASAATCTSTGYTGDTYCKTCSKRISVGTSIPATSHKDTNSDDKCDTCGTALSAPPVTGGSYTKFTGSQLVSGQYILLTSTGHAPHLLDGTWLTCVEPTISDNTVTDPKGAVWTLTVSGNSVTLTDANGNAIAPKGGNNNGITSGAYQWTWSYDSASGGFIFTGNGSDTVTLAQNEGMGNQFRGYKNTTAAGYPHIFTLYQLSSGGSTPSCTHSSTTVRNQTSATCTSNGYTGDTYCTACGAKTASGTTIPATGQHSFEEWIIVPGGGRQTRRCSVCGYEESKDLSDCTHQNTQLLDAKDPSCTTTGFTGRRVCHDCGRFIDNGTSIPANGHKDQDNNGICDSCKVTLQQTTPPVTEDPAPPVTEDPAPPATEDSAPPATEDSTPPATEDPVPPSTEHTEHTFGDWIGEDGEYFRVCSYCNYIETLTADPDPQPDPAPQQNWTPYIVIGIAVLSGITVTVILLVRKSKKHK